MPVSLSTVCEASLVSPLSALGRFLTFTLCEDSKAGTSQRVELRFQPRPSVSRWWGHILSWSMFCGREKRRALARMSSTSFCTSVKASADLCLSTLLVQLSNGMSFTDFSLSLLLKPHFLPTISWKEQASPSIVVKHDFRSHWRKTPTVGTVPYDWSIHVFGKDAQEHSLRNVDLQFSGGFC